MKKLLSLFLLIGASTLMAQNNSDDDHHFFKNEIKVNIPYLIAGHIEATYERVLTEDTAIGVALELALESDSQYKNGILPYYRLYFGKKPAAGFFIEGNGALYSERTSSFIDGNNNIRTEYDTGVGLGLAVGTKMMTGSNWTAEIFIGMGRNFANTEHLDGAYPRFGITVGRRF